jgi:hypothetical protein
MGLLSSCWEGIAKIGKTMFGMAADSSVDCLWEAGDCCWEDSGCGRHGGYVGESLQRCAISCVESVCCETEGFCAGKRVFLSSCCGFL